MNFSAIEDSVLEEKKKFSNFLSRILKNSRVLIILLIIAVVTTISVSIWIQSPDYQVLYNNLSNEHRKLITDQLNKMNIPYQFSENLGQLSVPKDKVNELRLLLSENNFPQEESIGFELLDKEKFGMSQFNQQINYQRALEGELSRTIKRINSIKNARVHIALPKSSLFLKDQKKPSASVILDLKYEQNLDNNQINAILHLIASSISGLSINNITLVDQYGRLLNHASFGRNQINDMHFKYSKEIESHYSKRIKNILEPLLGIGNVYAQVTAQIDFNSKEKTQEKYLPNSRHQNQSIRSRQDSTYKKVNTTEKNKINLLNNSFSDKVSYDRKIKKNVHGNKILKDDKKNLDSNINSDINHDYTINYELDHIVSHTKMNIGEVKRLSAAVIINFIKDENGKLIPLTPNQIRNIKKLISESIGYSKSRGDSIHVVNASFSENHNKPIIKLNTIHKIPSSSISFVYVPWCISILCILFALKKYICPISKNNIKNKQSIDSKKNCLQKDNVKEIVSELNIKNNLNIDNLIHKICDISNNNPRTIALIIRKWMSEKK